MDTTIQPIRGVQLPGSQDSGVMQPSQPQAYDPKQKVGGAREIAANPNNPPVGGARGSAGDGSSLWQNIQNLRNRGKKGQEGEESGSGEKGGKGSTDGKGGESGVKDQVEATKTALKAGRALAGDATAAADLAKQALTNPNELLKQAKTLQQMTPMGMANKYKWYILGAILMIALLIFLTFSGGVLGGLGDKAGTIPFSGNDYTGAYCAEMVDSIVSNGQKLILPNLIGGWSNECEFKDGKCADTGEQLSTAMRQYIKPSEVALADDNYITYRWPWTAWSWDGQNKSAGYVANWEKLMKEFSGKHIVVFNPELSTNNAFVGIAAESGPAPWTGTDQGKKNAQQKNLWETGTKGGYRTDSPKGYQGRLVGGPPKVTAAIHAQQRLGSDPDGHPIIVGFLRTDLYNQYPVGTTFTCTRQDRTRPTIKVTPTVPGVKEGAASLCGRASIMMVVLHYNSSYSSSTYLRRDSNGGYTALGEGDSCVSPSFIDNNSGGKTSGWGFVTSKDKSDQKIIDGIKRSLQNNDPVIAYSNPGMIFDTKHIFVIVGYDSTKDAFIVNNPNIGTVETDTSTPNGKLMTTAHLLQYLGDRGSSPSYEHAFLMKTAYME
jgi:hypothetical protein